MKNIQFQIIIILISLFLASALPNQYEAVMEAAIEKLYQAESPDALQAAGNTFERIAQKETDKWHPRYYAAHAKVMQIMRLQDRAQQDKLLDAALAHVEAAQALAPKNSELLTLEGFIHMMRIPIDPATRGPQYSALAMGALQQAVALDPQNPRAHLILGEMQYGTAQFLGSGTAEACANFKKAIELFENAEVENKLDPSWGAEWAMHNKTQKDCS